MTRGPSAGGARSGVLHRGSEVSTRPLRRRSRHSLPCAAPGCSVPGRPRAVAAPPWDGRRSWQPKRPTPWLRRQWRQRFFCGTGIREDSSVLDVLHVRVDSDCGFSDARLSTRIHRVVARRPSRMPAQAGAKELASGEWARTEMRSSSAAMSRPNRLNRPDSGRTGIRDRPSFSA